VDHVVYVLGAGFSAPLGLPVMGNFLMKAKDMYAADPQSYGHFKEVFDYISSMGSVQTYYEADLLNIEEILSVLEMRDQIGGNRSRRFVQLLVDVIKYYTPPPPRIDAVRFSANWYEYPMQAHQNWMPYFYFAMSLLGVRIGPKQIGQVARLIATRVERRPARYSIVTLNYDCVLECWSEFLTESLTNDASLRFGAAGERANDRDEPAVYVAKLHGSVDTNQVIAPTWNKGIDETMSLVWQRAHEILKTANQIRIIGYSLPVADAYIKYLLKSAVIDTPNLKAIDIICRDRGAGTLSRYKEFVRFGYGRFANTDVLLYFARTREETVREASVVNNAVSFDKLEIAHEAFFQERGTPLG
jgi:hypothetical protein